MNILLVGEAESVHMARWANQLCDSGWNVHLFQAGPGAVSGDLRCGTVHLESPQPVPVGVTARVTPGAAEYYSRRPAALAARVLIKRAVPRLVRVIEEVRPDIIHSLGLNHAWRNLCLPVLEARRLLGKRFTASWIYSSYGQDFAGYAMLSPDHRAEVEAVMPGVDYFVAECKRDARLADEMGFKGEFLGYLPAFGGVDLGHFASLSPALPPSKRRTIYLKGSDNSDGRGDPIGRAMTAMRAFELCADDLRDYRIIVGQTSPSIASEVPVLHAMTGLDIQAMPMMRAPHDSYIRMIGASRAMVAITANDGLPSTLVDAMALGALPIHSNLEPIAEWIRDGENGLLVPAEDPMAVAAALRKALRDDDFVDGAAQHNARLVAEHLSTEVVLPRAIKMYEHVMQQGPTRPRE